MTAETTYDVHPPQPRWTHVALRVQDIDATIDWYAEFTPLELLDRREDEFGKGAWMGMPDSPDRPFILVVAQFYPETDPFRDAPQEVLAPFAHLGIEMTSRQEIEAIADKAREAGCLAMEPTDMPPPIGYICMLSDPDGNRVEFSHDQGVYATARRVWGNQSA